MSSRGIEQNSDTILRDIGTVTSGSYGHRLQKAIALAYFRTSIANDNELEVEILGRPAPALITLPL